MTTLAITPLSMTPLIRMRNGEMHGLVNVLPNYVPETSYEKMKPDHKKELDKMRKEDNKLVKARYMNHRGAHERLSKPYCRYAGDPIQQWNFIPNEIYEIPMGLINEVNKSGLIKRSQEDGPNTNMSKVEGKDQIHEFTPISFF